MAEYIEREALSKWLHETMKVQTTTVGMAHVRDFWNKVLDAPAADVAPVVHGRWIEHYRTGIPFCSECDCDAVECGTNYCPNCGARMDGGFQNGNNHKDWPSYLDLPRKRMDGE